MEYFWFWVDWVIEKNKLELFFQFDKNGLSFMAMACKDSRATEQVALFLLQLSVGCKAKL